MRTSGIVSHAFAAVAALVAVVPLIGCGPPDAPKELDALTHFLFREWAHPTATVMEDGVAELDVLLNGLNLDGSLDDRSFRVTTLSKDDLADVTWPTKRNPKDAIGSCVARRSKWPLVDQAKLMASADQLDAEPSATAYVRRFIDPTDPACFVDGSCPVLLTDNDITRKNALLEVSFLLHKNMRWVRLGPDRWAIASRSWSDREWPGSKDGTYLRQSYSIDVFLGQADERAIRYQCSWSETDINLAVDDDLELSIVIGAVDEALTAADTTIEKRFHTTP